MVHTAFTVVIHKVIHLHEIASSLAQVIQTAKSSCQSHLHLLKSKSLDVRAMAESAQRKSEHLSLALDTSRAKWNMYVCHNAPLPRAFNVTFTFFQFSLTPILHPTTTS